MAFAAEKGISANSPSPGYIGRIPVRNLWLLMLYASDLLRQIGGAKVALEENPDKIPDLAAEILVRTVERRLKRNLTYGYERKEGVLSRVRGKINILECERGRLFERGQVSCRFEELTVNTIRNRFVRSALNKIIPLVSCSSLARKCRALSTMLERLGVSSERPNRIEILNIQIGRNDIDDKKMISAAKLVFDLALPTEVSGISSLYSPEREITWIRYLFEKAVAGFYDFTLIGAGWCVEAGKKMSWPIEYQTTGIEKLLPSMKTDIILEHLQSGQRIVIDTKFNSITTKGWYKDETIRSGYIYQMYAYLRSQEKDSDFSSKQASGLLLHPAIDTNVDEFVVIQGHKIRFATVDLGGKAYQIRKQLIEIAKSFLTQ